MQQLHQGSGMMSNSGLGNLGPQYLAVSVDVCYNNVDYVWTTHYSETLSSDRHALCVRVQQMAASGNMGNMNSMGNMGECRASSFVCIPSITNYYKRRNIGYENV